MASEDDFFIFRRFGDLNTRTILWMQDRIRQIEDDIRSQDELVAKSHPDDKLRNDSFVWDEKYRQQRHARMRELSDLLHRYSISIFSSKTSSTNGTDSFIDAYAKVRARPRAENRLVENVKNWLLRGAIAAEESSFIEHTDDLTSIHHRTRPPLGRWLESFQQLHRSRLFQSKHGNEAYKTSSATTYSSNSRFDFFTNTSIILGGLVMLLSPLWWLEYVNDNEKKLAVITGFICVFVGLMSVATVNRPGEVVAATAAYAAVLMVFMQVDGKGDKS
jgi:hypothetical protein